MKMMSSVCRLFLCASLFSLGTTANAGVPVWTFARVPGFPPTVSLNRTENATIKYTVTNQSHSSHILQMKIIQGITSAGCTSVLGYHEACTLTLSVSGSALQGDINEGPILCDTRNPLQCYRPSDADKLAITLTAAPSTPIISSSVSTLALSVSCLPASACTTTQNAALTGNARQITIQNTGTGGATNVAINSSGLPTGTSVSNTCGSTLNASSSCVITVTPGSVATSDVGSTACTAGTQPVAGTVTFTADGGISIQVPIYVLSYRCQYQGGFIYSIDDTTANSDSIGGKVASLVDQAAPALGNGTVGQAGSIIWSSNGNGSASGDVDATAILGIDQTSTTATPSPTAPAYPVGTPAFTACNGVSDGACNTTNIVSYYNFNRTSGGSAPTPLTFYAAGVCKATINGYSDWYLPSACDLSTEFNVIVTSCPSNAQSMWSSLAFLIGDPFAVTPSTSCSPPSGTECIAGYYWSSTESSFTPSSIAWIYRLGSDFNDYLSGPKSERYGVRCSRNLT